MSPSSLQRPSSGFHPPHRRNPGTRSPILTALAIAAGAVFFVLMPTGTAVADAAPSWATEPAPEADAANVPAYDGQYDGQDPNEYCAGHGLVRLQQQPLGGGLDGVVQMFYSRVCHSAWSRVRIDSAPGSPVVSIWPTLGRDDVTGADNQPDTSGAWISWSPMLHADALQCVTADASVQLADGTIVVAPTLRDCS